MQRSRLKMTLLGTGVLLLSLWPVLWIIKEKLDHQIFEFAVELSSYVGILSILGAVIGYYVNKETNKPSLQNNTYVNVDQTEDYRELAGEDETDPEDIPL